MKGGTRSGVRSSTQGAAQHLLLVAHRFPG